MMLVVVLWLAAAYGVARYAERVKGRSGSVYFISALFLSPLLIGLVALLVKANPAGIAQEAIRRGLKKCPACAEMVG